MISHALSGHPGAPGIAIGPIWRSLPPPSAPTTAPEDYPAEEAHAALKRFAAAQRATVEELLRLATQLRSEGHREGADILETQALFAEDMAISDEVRRRVANEAMPLEPALAATIALLRSQFAAMDEPYWRERAADIDAVGTLLQTALRTGSVNPSNLSNLSGGLLADVPPHAIILAADLTPAETADLRGQRVAGFATAAGGPTSHTAILARALGIPAVVGLGAALLELPDLPAGTEALLDGSAGVLIVAPTPTERAAYEQRLQQQQAAQCQRQALHERPGQLADGQRVALRANIGRSNEAAHALEQGAEGIGLFRTEFLFLERSTPPNEEEQYAAYRATLATMAGRPVIIRTLDVGGDKHLPYLDIPPEPNPFLGIRGLRLAMHHPQLFQTQLRALLRAAYSGDLRVMLPMIATPDDLAWGRAQLQAAAASLATEGIAHRADVRLGAMIETPAAAVTADLLARDAAFFSIGSNDLAQYTLAADRGSSTLAASYPHDAPAVLRLIAQAAAAAHRSGIPIGVCGELAGVPEIAPLLVGLGITELSMAPAAIPAVKERLQTLTLAEAQAAAQQAIR